MRVYRDYLREMLNDELFVFTKRYGPFFPRLGLITRPHKLFVPGDVVIVTPDNGSNVRDPVFAMSRKRRRVIHYYMKHHAPYAYATYEAGPLYLPELPDELSGLRISDPGVLAYVRGLRAAYVPHGR